MIQRILLGIVLLSLSACTPETQPKVHRLVSTKRAIYDAFVYVNRIPEKPEEGETAEDIAGRIFGRLANQEGRVLLKLPAGMDRDSYLAFKTFFRYEGEQQVGNCAACHSPAEFADSKTHVVARGGKALPTPSLRNLDLSSKELEQVILGKIAASKLKRAGEADEIDDAYAAIRLEKEDVPGLLAYLGLLKDVPDAKFRDLILEATVLDTSEDVENQ
tara:strand:+ start:32 stop:682 length:651 start_codon:yes stop_codon:yes gene_type:complete